MTGRLADVREERAGAAKARSSPLRATLVILAAAIPVFAALIALGTWQVHRLAWKEALIATVAARTTAAPVALPQGPGFDPADQQYLKVAFTAALDLSREFHVFATLGEPKGPYGGMGWWVVSPARLPDGKVLFVNRGFVPKERADPATRPEGQIAGRHDFVGLVRPPEPLSWPTPAPNAAKNEWFNRDPAAFAKAMGLDPASVLPFTVDLVAGEAPGGLPEGGETIVAFPNSHLGYAITWYGLAIGLVVIVGEMIRRRWTAGGLQRP